jgi:hypothetical protein
MDFDFPSKLFAIVKLIIPSLGRYAQAGYAPYNILPFDNHLLKVLSALRRYAVVLPGRAAR